MLFPVFESQVIAPPEQIIGICIFSKLANFNEGILLLPVANVKAMPLSDKSLEALIKDLEMLLPPSRAVPSRSVIIIGVSDKLLIIVILCIISFLNYQHVIMEANIIIPSPLRNFTNGERRIIMESLDAPTTIKILVEKLDEKFPGIINKILDTEGKVHNYVNIFLDSEDIRYIDGLNTEVSHGEEISIVPAVAGGYY